MPLRPHIDPSTLSPERTAQRRARVAESVGRIRDIEASRGMSRDALEDIAGELDRLAALSELFDTDDFPDPDADAPARLYLLNEDPGGRFPLYLTCVLPGGTVPPHNHTTWAVVSGLSGEEQNTLWQRVSGGESAGAAEIIARETVGVAAGQHLALMPDDIHSVATPGRVPRRHFHMYGMSLERLPRRLVFDIDAGRCRVMEANPKIVRVSHA